MTRLRNIGKSFGATPALDGVSLEIRPGEILAVVGENGAGKTTLMRIAAGEIRPDSGEVVRDGEVELVHQHFMLVAEMTVAENLALGRRGGFRFASRKRLEREAETAIETSGIALSGVNRRVASLSVGEKSKLELIKAITRNPATLVLDEPTSVLTPSESEELFLVMRRLAAAGTAVVFISHKLPEVLSVAGRIAVMRGGRLIEERMTGETSAGQLAAAMIGDTSGWAPSPGTDRVDIPAPRERPAPLRLERVSGAVLDGVDLEVHAGEIVAIVGVAGNGQSELAAMLRGIARPRAGRITIEAHHTGHIPEDRTRDGIVGGLSIAENLALHSRRWRTREVTRHAARMIELYSIRASGPAQRAGDLSGGNQQKVILARELDPRPAVIVAAEPSRGLDIEATAFVHGQLRAAAAAGAAILMITSDLDEAFGLASAMHVIYRGRLSPRLGHPEAAERVGTLMTGVA